MHPIPQRISIVRQTEAVLIKGMQSQRWKHVLPGERLLSAELRVSRWTLRAALAQLGRAGRVNISHGRPCEITARARSRGGRPSSTRIAILVPKPLSQLRLFVALWVDELRTILFEQGIGLSVINSTRAYRARGARALADLVADHPHDGWVLLLSRRGIQEWFTERGIPALVAGGRYEGIKLPALDIDNRAVGVHIGRALYGLGHRQMALLMPSDPPAGVLAGEAGFRSALSLSSDSPEELRVMQVGDRPGEISQAVDRLLGGPHRPTVLAVSRANVALSVHSHLLNRGLHIPWDVSLVSLEWEPYLEWVTPAIAHYALSPFRYANGVARLLARRLEIGTPSGATFMTPEFVRGASLGAPHSVSK